MGLRDYGESVWCTVQGTSQTMEDTLELGRQVALHGATEEALRAYEAVRCDGRSKFCTVGPDSTALNGIRLSSELLDL